MMNGVLKRKGGRPLYGPLKGVGGSDDLKKRYETKGIQGKTGEEGSAKSQSQVIKVEGRFSWEGGLWCN